MNNEPLRPDPDRLLEQTAAPHRGKLKVFFGACAGVGKTWAMLAEAQRLRAQGLDIVVGVVETHGRIDTAAMLEGMTARIEEELGYPVKAVATGGFGREVAEHCRLPLQYDGHLLLEGLRIIYEKNKKER